MTRCVAGKVDVGKPSDLALWEVGGVRGWFINSVPQGRCDVGNSVNVAMGEKWPLGPTHARAQSHV